MPGLHVYVLGPFRATLDGKPVDGFALDKVRALLAYLSVEDGQAYRRETLATLLWPDQPNSTALKNLRHALYKLRMALGDADNASDPSFLLVTPQTAQLNPASVHRVDLSDFTRLVSACRAHNHRRMEVCASCHARLREASELYRGDFLEGFSLDDSQPFDEWLMLERDGLRQQALEVFGHLADYHDAAGQAAQALVYARRQLELEPWGEEVHRRVMRLLVGCGQRNAALAQYEACRKVLAEELGAEPELETTQLYESIKAGEAEPRSDTRKEAGSPAEAPAGEPRKNNLPQPLTSFIERKDELAEIAEMLQDPGCRLITLTGIGGVGKTRLALQAASQQIGMFRDGVYFVPLAAIDSPEYIVSSIAQAFNFRLQGEEKPRPQLLSYLAEKEMLLVLDNFEHLLEAGAEGQVDEGRSLLIDMLRTAPHVSIIVTSRESLGLQAEFLFAVSGLNFPGAEVLARGEPAEADLAKAGKFSAVQLLVERGRRVNRNFALSPQTVNGVIRICRATAGVPLAIELAAVWVRDYSINDLADSIARNLDFVAADLRDLPGAHRSLRAVFNHSWGLLSEQERAVFRKLSVFHGGWDARAAKEILFGAGASEQANNSVAQILTSLAGKSLLVQPEPGRFDVHQLLRQYASEKLDQLPDEREAARAAHAHYYLQLIEIGARELRGPHQQELLEQMEREHNNLRAALRWARGADDPGQENLDVALSLVAAMWRLWSFHSYIDEGRANIAAVLSLVDKSDEPMAGWQPERKSALAQTFFGGAALARVHGDYPAVRSSLDRALQVFTELDNKEGIVRALNFSAVIADDEGDYPRADALYAESLAITQQLSNRYLSALLLNNWSNVAREQGDFASAHARLNESLSIAREENNTYLQALSLLSLGLVLEYQSEYSSAIKVLKESLRLNMALGITSDIANCVDFMARVVGPQGDIAQAARLWGTTEVVRETIGIRMPPSDQLRYNRSVAAMREKLGEEEFARAWSEGRSMSLEEAAKIALEA